MKYRNLTIIGTSHIARQSLEEVKNHILDYKPDIIALELDKRRLYGLMSDTKEKPRLRDIREIGLKGWLFSIIGAWVEEKLGKVVGIKPGSEMVTAVQCARQIGAKLALIDQDIEVTLKRFSKEFTWREKFRLVVDMFRGMIFRKSEMRRLGLEGFDLTKVPSEKVVKKMLKEVKRRYPSFYRVLVTERNRYMAKSLANVMHKHMDKEILAIVGAGHEKEMLALIKKELKLKEEKPALNYSYHIS